MCKKNTTFVAEINKEPFLIAYVAENDTEPEVLGENFRRICQRLALPRSADRRI